MFSDIYSDLIPSIYDSSISPDLWVTNLDRISTLIGAKGAGLLLIETRDVYHYSISHLSSCYTAEEGPNSFITKYQSEYSKYEEEAFRKLCLSEPLTLVRDELFESDRQAASLRPDVAYLKKHFGVFDRFGVRLNSEHEFTNGMTFQYDSSRGNVTQSEWKLLQPLFLHIRTAVEISRTFTLLRSRYNAVLSALASTIGAACFKDGSASKSECPALDRVMVTYR